MTDPERVRFVVLLDANVLAKPVTRTLIMASGALSGYGATWGRYEEDEADRHMRSGQAAVSEVRALSGSELTPPGASANTYSATSAKDRQVLADADAARALFIITEDVDDFDNGDLETAGIAAVNPDLFMSLVVTAEAYLEALSLMVKRFHNPPRTMEQLHARLGREHPMTVNAHMLLFPGVQPMAATDSPPATLYLGKRCVRCLQNSPTVRLGLCPACEARRAVDDPMSMRKVETTTPALRATPPQEGNIKPSASAPFWPGDCRLARSGAFAPGLPGASAPPGG